MFDALNIGDETDRLMARWKVKGDQPKTKSVILNPKPSNILIKIPENIVSIREISISENLKWRYIVRAQFLNAFNKDGIVVGFSANNEYVIKMNCK